MTLTLIDDQEATLDVAELTTTLTEAARTGATVAITYVHPRNGRTARIVRPRRLANNGDVIRVWDVVRDDYRSFRLDRIASVDVIS